MEDVLAKLLAWTPLLWMDLTVLESLWLVT